VKVNKNAEFPRPIHILSDGSALDRLTIVALLESFDAYHSVANTPAQKSGARSSPMNWARRHVELDGVGGLVSAVKSRFRPAARVLVKSLPWRADAAATRDGDEIFVQVHAASSRTLIASPDSLPQAQTLVVLGDLVHTSATPNVVRLHIGWPSLPGRQGVLSALTHRNLGAVRVVVEVSGPHAGWATASPPIARDDDVDSIHRRLHALGADLLVAVITDPAATLMPLAPAKMSSTIVDEQAVRSDLRSGRFGELVREITRF
jgi:hypothetical protein